MRRICVLALMIANQVSIYASFDGQSIRAEVLFPNVSTISPDLFAPEIATIGPGVDFEQVESPGGNGLIAVDFSGNNLLLTNINGDRVVLPACADCFYYRFSDDGDTLPDITGVTISGDTSMLGFDASQIFFDADTIRLRNQN